MNLISEEFKEELLKITPDYSDAIKVEGINVSETGYLLGDDAEVPFDSIMLYSGLTVKQDKIYQNGGLSRTRLNKVPSNNDFEMINKIY